MDSNGQSLRAFAAAADLPEIQLRRWFREKGRSIPEHSVAQLADTLGITAEQARSDAGPVHADDRRNRLRSEGASRRYAAMSPAQRQDLHRKGAAGRRGWKEPAAGVAKRVAIMRATGGFDRFIAAATASAKTDKGRASRALYGRLRDKPSPTSDETRVWAGRASARLHLCIGEVIRWWNPWLKARGLSQLGGRPGDIKQCTLMRGYLATNPKVYGMWLAAPQTKEWCRDHSGGCPALRLALAQVRRGNSEETSPKAAEVAMAG